MMKSEIRLSTSCHFFVFDELVVGEILIEISLPVFKFNSNVYSSSVVWDFDNCHHSLMNLRNINVSVRASVPNLVNDEMTS